MNDSNESTDRQKHHPLLLSPFRLADVHLYEIRVERCDLDQGEQSPAPISVQYSIRDESPDAEEFSRVITLTTTISAEDGTGIKIRQGTI